jgi:hypothetical protein
MNDDNTIIAKTTDDRPSVKLIERAATDGTAFAILGACSMAARTAGWSDGRWNKFHDEATSGNYDHLLRTVNKHFVIE